MSHAQLQRTSCIGALAMAAVAIVLWIHAARTGGSAWMASLATILAGQAVITHTTVYCHSGTQLNSKTLTDQLAAQLIDDLRAELSDGLRDHIVPAVDAAMVDYVRNIAETKRVEDRLRNWSSGGDTSGPVPLRALSRLVDGNTA